MAKVIACGPLSEETEEALNLHYTGGMLKDFIRTNDFAIQLQESNRQLRTENESLRARVAALEKALRRIAEHYTDTDLAAKHMSAKARAALSPTGDSVDYVSSVTIDAALKGESP